MLYLQLVHMFYCKVFISNGFKLKEVYLFTAFLKIKLISNREIGFQTHIPQQSSVKSRSNLSCYMSVTAINYVTVKFHGVNIPC